MKFSIDRFEGEFAVIELENQKIISIPKAILPKESKEGDILAITIQQEETIARKKELSRLASSLFEEN